MAGTFNYRFKENYHSKTCVVKYTFGTKFFIWKALHLKQGTEQVFRDLNNKIARYKTGALSEDDLFYNVAKHCSKARVIFALVEVLFESDDLCLIMEFDQQQLTNSIGDQHCLNLSTEQYLPGWLKCVKPNKALQSIISPPASIPTREVPDVKPQAKEIAAEPKLAPTETAVFNPADILKRMKAVNGNS
jgi:hypothetical protein